MPGARGCVTAPGETKTGVVSMNTLPPDFPWGARVLLRVLRVISGGEKPVLEKCYKETWEDYLLEWFWKSPDWVYWPTIWVLRQHWRIRCALRRMRAMRRLSPPGFVQQKIAQQKKFMFREMKNVGAKRKFKLPRGVWSRRPATQVAPDRKKEESRRACRRKDWEKEKGNVRDSRLEVLFAVYFCL